MGSWSPPRAVWALCLSGFLLGSSLARAQPPAASETAAARQLFQDGLAALDREDWAAARDAFTRSYELAPRASTLLNLATAQAELGLLVEAMESYRTFASEATGRQRRLVRDARRAMEELEPRLAHVELRIPDLAAGDVVRLDERALPAAALEVPLPMNPGSRHRLTVLRDGRRIGEVELALAEGERRAAEVTLHPPPPVVEAPTLTDGSGDDTGLWVGLGIGAGVLVAAGAVVLGVVLSQPGGDPYVGNLGPGMIRF